VELELLNVQRHQGAGVLVYLREYLSFLVRSAWVAARLHRRRHFRLAQVHSLPDFLVFAAMPLRLTGVPLILDLHEAMPEFFKTRFPGAANPVTYRLLLLSERLSIAVATRVLTVNDAMCSRLLRLGVRPDKLTVVINSPSLGRFDATAHPTRAFREDGRLRLVYTGALTPTYELDVALRALAAIAVRRPDLDVRLDLYGRGDSEDALRTLAAELGLGERVVFHGRIPIEDVPRAVAEADIGLAPTRLDPFTHMTLSTKVYEYAAMRKAVVASRLPLIQESFPPDTVMAYEPGNEDEMTGAILALADDAAERVARIERTLEIVRETSWEVASRPYLALVEQVSRSV
jgi:glycosyltransferase involved in cell wall biosynthesis